MDMNVDTIMIDQNICIGCATCATNCPTSMIEMRDGKAHVLYRKTSCKCFRCMGTCPVKAITKVKLSEVPAELLNN